MFKEVDLKTLLSKDGHGDRQLVAPRGKIVTVKNHNGTKKTLLATPVLCRYEILL